MDSFNFKEIAEKCIDGESSGVFLLRVGSRVSSSRLSRNTTIGLENLPYKLGNWNYDADGNFSVKLKNYPISRLDIIDFIPDTNMKENELTIEIPEGFEIDKENSSFEKIVFKKKRRY